MSSPAVTIPMTGSLDEAARIMVDRRIHRLVATDDTGHPVGVLWRSISLPSTLTHERCREGGFCVSIWSQPW
jgi:predicted transcriptional regulator